MSASDTRDAPGDDERDDGGDFDSLTGRLLLAMPGIGDPRFRQAVVLICSHGPDHAMGLRLDQVMPQITLGDILDKLDLGDGGDRAGEAVLNGGPVERERGFVLHGDDFHVDGSTLEVSEGLAMTGTKEVLRALSDPATAPENAILALGYAGWDGGQLEGELAENAWLVAPADPALIFGLDHDGKWARAVASLGVEPGMLSGQAGHA